MQPRRSGLPALFAIILTKLGKLMKFVKAAKFLKPLITLASMLVSVFAYSFMQGPWFAIGLVIMLFVHEMGHVFAAWHRGLPVSAPIFIPFLGAAIFTPKMEDRDTEAYVGFGGPLLGTLAAALLFLVYLLLPRDLPGANMVLAVSNVAVFLNLFNLIPVSPLDGGRVTQAVGQCFKYVGFMMLLAFTVLMREPSFFLIWIIVILELRFPLKLKALLVQACTVLMTVLMALGYSGQPWPFDLIDIILASSFTVMITLASRSDEDDPTVEAVDTRPALAPARRYQWLGLYLTLSIILIGLMSAQISLIVQHHPAAH